MTLPGIIQNYQKKVLRVQFAKAYTVMQEAFKKAEHNLGYTPECYYKLGFQQKPLVCPGGKNEFGHCQGGWQAEDGSPLLSAYTDSGCKELWTEVEKNYKIIHQCKLGTTNCLPKYKGYEEVLREDDSLKEGEADSIISNNNNCPGWSKNGLNKAKGFAMPDGSFVIGYGNGSTMLFAIDVNGKKGPNQWGYDLHFFSIAAPVIGGGPLKVEPSRVCKVKEKGGTWTGDMMIEMHK